MPKTKGNRYSIKGNRYSISVSGRTYERMRSAIPRGSIASFVDEIVTTALDDPETMARLVERCWYEERARS